MCWTISILRALKSLDFVASSNESGNKIRHFEADMVASEVTGTSQKWSNDLIKWRWRLSQRQFHHKKCSTHSRVCRMTFIWCVMQNLFACASAFKLTAWCEMISYNTYKSLWKHFFENRSKSKIFFSTLSAEIGHSGANHRVRKPPCRPQSVGKASLTQRWMRQGQSFSAHVKLTSCDTHKDFCKHFFENRVKFTQIFKQRLHILGQTSDLERRHIGPKVSENQVWHTVGCANIKAFQRTSN